MDKLSGGSQWCGREPVGEIGHPASYAETSSRRVLFLSIAVVDHDSREPFETQLLLPAAALCRRVVVAWSR